jgi:hypothetical protein
MAPAPDGPPAEGRLTLLCNLVLYLVQPVPAQSTQTVTQTNLLPHKHFIYRRVLVYSSERWQHRSIAGTCLRAGLQLPRQTSDGALVRLSALRTLLRQPAPSASSAADLARLITSGKIGPACSRLSDTQMAYGTRPVACVHACLAQRACICAMSQVMIFPCATDEATPEVERWLRDASHRDEEHANT